MAAHASEIKLNAYLEKRLSLDEGFPTEHELADLNARKDTFSLLSVW